VIALLSRSTLLCLTTKEVLATVRPRFPALSVASKFGAEQPERVTPGAGTRKFSSVTVNGSPDELIEATPMIVADDRGAFQSDDAEHREGRLFCLYLKSHFLDYVARATVDLYSGTLRHWGIICGDHVVDAVTTDDPQCRRVNRSEPRVAPDGGSD
jgi:hypothetical protein